MIDILLLIVLPLVIWYYGCCRVKLGHTVFLERGGSYFKQLKPGIQFFIPFLQRTHTVHWRNSALKLDDYNIPQRSLRFRSKEIRTHGPNNGKVKVSFNITFTIVDPRTAVYEVENLYQHIEDAATALLESALQKSLQLAKLNELFNANALDLKSVGVRVESLTIANLVHRPPKNAILSPLESHLEYVRAFQKEFPCSVTELAALIAALKS